MSRDIGIDLGTANVLIHLKGRGIVVNEPAIVAVDVKNEQVIEVGKGAYEMLGRQPQSIKLVRPLKGGVIADYDLAEAMLVLMLDKIHSRSWFSKPNVLISAPSNVSEVEQKSLMEATERAVGGKIFIEEETLVAAIGAGVSPFSKESHMVLDIGGGTCDVALIIGGEVVKSSSLKIAGDDFDAAIIQYVKDHFQLLIGERSAESAKKSIATAILEEDSDQISVPLKGRDLVTGLPKSINLTAKDLYHALSPHFTLIANHVARLVQELAPEVAGDIYENGIIMTGGGAMIRHLDTYLTNALKVSVVKADQPMACVALGSGLMLEMILSGQLERIRPTLGLKLQRWLKQIKRRIIGY